MGPGPENEARQASVLVVDDDASVRDLLVDVLEGAGYRVHTAVDGAAALDLASRQPPDLLLADLRMPTLDGLGLAVALADRGLGAVPTLFMSGMGRPDTVPPERFVPKPFDLDALLAAIAETLAGRRPVRSPGVAAVSAGAPRRPVVLVVDDDEATRQVLQDVLEEAGYAVALAGSGAEAVARLEAGGVDLVLLDLMLPDVDGLEICLRVRAQESGAYLPIIMLTALDSAARRHAGFRVGADDYIVKPFRLEDLLDRVGVWVRTRQRLKAAHERVTQAVERRAHDEAVVVMARTAGDELKQPLTVLLGMLELWRAGRFAAADASRVDAELQGAMEALLARVDALEQADHYATKPLGDLVLLDLDRARGSSPLAAN